MQRLVYRYFLGNTWNDEEDTPPLTTILTTHSPHIASVTPIRSIVLLRHDVGEETTIAVSTAKARSLSEMKRTCSATSTSAAARSSSRAA